ncbi:MAG: ABC-F family ATP-binding cassette domain-containing protein, partial [Clostridia bacterium]|nr:ABC-F family ATP-binding cassette domain-containing protein [Clostridia bacterium]
MRGSNLHLAFGTEVIYDDAEFYIGDNDKTGIVGVNGAGKTTLFRVILKEQELDAGQIVTGNARIGYLPQEIDFSEQEKTVWDYLFDARPINKIENELNSIYERLSTAEGEEQAYLLERMEKLQARLEDLDFYNAEGLLLDLISSMHIDSDLLDKRRGDLSGGQKSKVAFAHVLYSKPQILLLDEPTNHLDVQTKDFVTNFIKNYKGAVLIISHDVDFLNEVVNKILFVNKVTHKMKVYDGNYTVFKRKYAQEQVLKELRISQQEAEIKKLTDFIQKARQASRTNHNLKRMGFDREAKLE